MHVLPRRLALLVLLAGCPKDREPDPAAVLLEHLAAADRLWAARARTGLDAVSDYLDGLPPALAADPRVRWRRVRLLVSRALVADDARAARRWLASGRDEGVDCAYDRTGALGPSAWRDRATCAAWAAMAWARWMEAFGGEAAAVDEAAVRELLALPARDGQTELATWVGAKLDAVLRPGPDRREELVAVLTRVLREADALGADDVWVRWGDLAALAPEVARERLPGRRPRYPEEVAVAARFRALTSLD